MAKIISVSRRTDIPAFYGEWFMKRINESFAGFVNPFGGQKYIVPLKPEDVICFVFWSKNFQPFMESLDILDEMGYKFYFNYTITGLPDIFECNLVKTEIAIDALKKISEKYSPKHINWRYDPIVISNITDENFHLKNFEKLCSELKGYVERCYFSYAIQYGKVKRNFEQFEIKNKINILDPDVKFKQELANKLTEIAGAYGITMYTCCADILITEKIKKAHCIDGDIINELFFNSSGLKNKILPTRKECGCTLSTDIGAYDTCPHGCIYCYANMNKELANKVFSTHDSESSFLGYSKSDSDNFLLEVKERPNKENIAIDQIPFNFE